MIRIAICDDKKPTTANLEELLQSYSAEKHLEFEILYFSTPSSLYDHMCRHTMDIIFMDLDFGNELEDGIIWAKRIHQDFPQTLVLILTVHDNRYKEGYVAKAFRFMTKPFTTEELYKNMGDCLEELYLYQTVTLSRHGNIKKIPLQDILYFAAQAGEAN